MDKNLNSDNLLNVRGPVGECQTTDENATGVEKVVKTKYRLKGPIELGHLEIHNLTGPSAPTC